MHTETETTTIRNEIIVNPVWPEITEYPEEVFCEQPDPDVANRVLHNAVRDSTKGHRRCEFLGVEDDNPFGLPLGEDHMIYFGVLLDTEKKTWQSVVVTAKYRGGDNFKSSASRVTVLPPKFKKKSDAAELAGKLQSSLMV